MRIHSLYFYPVKSCAGISTDRLPLRTEGPLWDREWMIVDENGKFVSQRDLPELSQIRPEIQPNHLKLKHQQSAIEIPLSQDGRQERRVEVWGDEVTALDEGEAAANWLSAILRKTVRLVRIHGERLKGDEQKRSIRFPDSYPLHLCSLGSLKDLNNRLSSPVEILRFRPNIVIEGAPAFAEDNWQGIKIENWEFPIGKACARCTITTVDPATGERAPEPLKTLSTYRRNGNKVEFGQYLLSVEGAKLTVGMKVTSLP